MTLTDQIAQLRTLIATKLAERNTIADELSALREAGTDDEAKVAELRSRKDALDADLDAQAARMADLEAEQARDEAATRLQAEVHAAGVPTTRTPATNVRVGQEARTYRPDVDKTGRGFLADVGQAFLGDLEARDRLTRHMAEERVERGPQFDRAAGTGAFAGLVVPQYLTDLYAPQAKAGRPFADVCNKHELPAEGMTVNLSRITTGTSSDLQAAQNDAVSETDVDDTLLSISVQTNAGQQTLTRQAIERGAGVEGVMLDDLFRAHATKLDSTLLNQATNGLTNVATAITYDDASPTVPELYPKIIGGLAAVEAALLDQDPGDNVVVMHSRRWYWFQAAVGTSWPFVGQPGISQDNVATNLATSYGSGARGVLPNGTVVIVDNNIGTTLGGGTEDEIYIGSRRESHLWEDPNAPMLIRAEQPKAANLGVLFVLYSYFAYTHGRYAHAQKIAGTGLAAPSF